MMSISGKWRILITAALLLALALLAACGDDDEEIEPTAEDITIKIGLLTDKTGPAAEALIPVDTAMNDVIRACSH
ncbi:MAG: hypothetical protein R6U37_03160 [Dehalococcoidia bacterium]